jgi:uncharacterized protein YbaR (Trm112 family)/SAM-dependent methyltransferase
MENAITLICPETKLPLRRCALAEAERSISGGKPLLARPNGTPAAIGPTAEVMLREDCKCAYPIVDGIPVILIPEMLTGESDVRSFDLNDLKWAEAYQEMEHYNAVCDALTDKVLSGEVLPLPLELPQHADTFPLPTELWIDAAHDAMAEMDAYSYLGTIRGKRTAQLGGKGGHAVKFLIAGARESWLVTPMLGECRYARALAHTFGVEDRLHCVAAVGEQIPLPDRTFDIVYSGGCIHHMVAEHVAAEIMRVLAPGGRFSSVDPWKTMLHTVGTRVLGKREKNVHCKPMTAKRLAPFHSGFSKFSVNHHGPVLRYFLIGFCQLLKIDMSPPLGFRLGRLEDWTLSRVPFLRDRGGSIALMGAKALDDAPVR